MSEEKSTGKPSTEDGAVENRGRREALIKIGKYAAYVPPTLVTIGTARGLPSPSPTPTMTPSW